MDVIQVIVVTLDCQMPPLSRHNRAMNISRLSAALLVVGLMSACGHAPRQASPSTTVIRLEESPLSSRTTTDTVDLRWTTVRPHFDYQVLNRLARGAATLPMVELRTEKRMTVRRCVDRQAVELGGRQLELTTASCY